MKCIKVESPSNIALIKYMGKNSMEGNIPSNGSLSLTLNELASVAELRESQAGKNVLIPESPDKNDDRLKLPEMIEFDKGSERFISHLERCIQLMGKQFWKRWDLPFSSPQKGIEIRCANRFPAGTGIASSASSFSALTLAVAAYLCDDQEEFLKSLQKNEFKGALSDISRQGSGSSCRSFMGPWVEWSVTQNGENRVSSLDSKFPKMADLILLLDSQPKKVSSSEAHQRIKTSPLWSGRLERVNRRIQSLKEALNQNHLSDAASVVWQESWEMHSLFHTSEPPFTYWQSRSLDVLAWFEGFMGGKEPPLVTMDAGPNIHCVVPQSQVESWKARIHARFPDLTVLQDFEGTGARVIEWIS